MSESEVESTEKMVIIATHGPEDPERASFPFVLGNAALAMDSEVTIVLQGTGVFLAKKGCYEHVFSTKLPPLKELVQSFVELGGKIWICVSCIEERGITKDMLIDEAEPTAAGKVVLEVLGANATLNY